MVIFRLGNSRIRTSSLGNSTFFGVFLVFAQLIFLTAHLVTCFSVCNFWQPINSSYIITKFGMPKLIIVHRDTAQSSLFIIL